MLHFTITTLADRVIGVLIELLVLMANYRMTSLDTVLTLFIKIFSSFQRSDTPTLH
jgi:hypothetical protein